MTDNPSQTQGGNEDVRGVSIGAATRPSGGRIKPFPKGFARSGGVSEIISASERGEIRESIGSGKLPSTGTDSTPSNAPRNTSNSEPVTRGSRRRVPSAEQFNRRIRNSAGDNTDSTVSAEHHSPATGTGTRSGSQTVSEGLLQERVNDTPNFNVAVETKTSLSLPQDGEVVPTAMLQRELSSTQERHVPILIEDTPREPFPKEDVVEFTTPPRPHAKPQSTKNKNKNQTAPPAKQAETIKVEVDFKFDKATFKALVEWFVWTSKGVDLGVDYGLGVDTSLIPIWEMDDKEAEVFVRILERRAGTSETIRDVVVPKMLASRDYIEAGMILAPRFGATVQSVVQNGGVHPHFSKRSPKDESK